MTVYNRNSIYTAATVEGAKTILRSILAVILVMSLKALSLRPPCDENAFTLLIRLTKKIYF